MMLGSQSQSMCAINCPQTSVSQNRLCADDDLKIIQHTHTYKINYLPDFKNEKPASHFTLLTRDITAKMAASGMTVVSMSSLERLVAISCP